MRMFNFGHDPGPCPVDDAAHTTCTAPAGGPVVVGDTMVVNRVIIATGTRPAADIVNHRGGQPPAAPAAPPPVTFTTKSYRRSLHGKKRSPEVAR